MLMAFYMYPECRTNGSKRVQCVNLMKSQMHSASMDLTGRLYSSLSILQRESKNSTKLLSIFNHALKGVSSPSDTVQLSFSRISLWMQNAPTNLMIWFSSVLSSCTMSAMSSTWVEVLTTI